MKKNQLFSLLFWIFLLFPTVSFGSKQVAEVVLILDCGDELTAKEGGALRNRLFSAINMCKVPIIVSAGVFEFFLYSQDKGKKLQKKLPVETFCETSGLPSWVDMTQYPIEYLLALKPFDASAWDIYIDGTKEFYLLIPKGCEYVDGFVIDNSSILSKVKVDSFEACLKYVLDHSKQKKGFEIVFDFDGQKVSLAALLSIFAKDEQDELIKSWIVWCDGHGDYAQTGEMQGCFCKQSIKILEEYKNQTKSLKLQLQSNTISSSRKQYSDKALREIEKKIQDSFLDYLQMVEATPYCFGAEEVFGFIKKYIEEANDTEKKEMIAFLNICIDCLDAEIQKRNLRKSEIKDDKMIKIHDSIRICGLSYDDFCSLLSFFEKGNGGKCFYYFTCFGGGYNLKLVQDFLLKEKISYPVIAAALTDSVIYSPSIQPYDIRVDENKNFVCSLGDDLSGFFDAIKKGKDFCEALCFVKKNRTDCAWVFTEHNKKFILADPSNRTLLIDTKNSKGKEVLEVNPKSTLWDYLPILVLDVKNIERPLQFNKNKLETLRVFETLPVIVSTQADFAEHTFKHINLKNTSLEDFLIEAIAGYAGSNSGNDIRSLKRMKVYIETLCCSGISKDQTLNFKLKDVQISNEFIYRTDIEDYDLLESPDAIKIKWKIKYKLDGEIKQATILDAVYESEKYGRIRSVKFLEGDKDNAFSCVIS